MSARDELITVLDAKGGWRSTALSDALADRIMDALRAMPEPDRLALARELAGPGYAVVPVEPTRAMMECAVVRHYNKGSLAEVWTAMLTAAQEPTP